MSQEVLDKLDRLEAGQSELRSEVAGLRSELKTGLDGLRIELLRSIGESNQAVQDAITALREQVTGRRTPGPRRLG